MPNAQGDYDYNPLDVADAPGRPSSAEPARRNKESATVDLTSERPEPVGGDTRSDTFEAFANPGLLRPSNTATDQDSAQCLGSWLQPVVASPKKATKRRRQRPSQGADGPGVRRGSATAWGGASSPGRDNRGDGSSTRNNGGGNDGTLSAWLEPRQPAATSGKQMARGTAVAERESDGGFSDDDEGGGEDGSGRWMSDRLEGLDPSGAAR